MNGKIEITQILQNNRKCKCLPMCTEYFRVNEIDVYCKKELEQLAFNILNLVNGTNIAQGNHVNNGWTTGMEQTIINYINRHGVQNGTYAKLAVMLNKKREQVKGKVYQLEKQGRLTFERVEMKKRASEKAFNNLT